MKDWNKMRQKIYQMSFQCQHILVPLQLLFQPCSSHTYTHNLCQRWNVIHYIFKKTLCPILWHPSFTPLWHKRLRANPCCYDELSCASGFTCSSSISDEGCETWRAVDSLVFHHLYVGLKSWLVWKESMHKREGNNEREREQYTKWGTFILPSSTLKLQIADNPPKSPQN